MLTTVGRKLTQASPIVGDMRRLYKTAGAPSYASIGRITGLSDKTVRHYLDGETDRPDEERVLSIIQAIKSIGERRELEHEADDHAQRIAEGFALTVAVRSWRGVLASTGDEDCYLEKDGMAEIPTAFLVGGMDKMHDHEVARLAGQSMSPRIESGERVIVYMDPTPIPNALMMVQCPEGRVMIKVVRARDGKWAFESIHPSGISCDNPEGWVFKGVVVAILGHEGGRNIEWTGRPLRA